MLIAAGLAAVAMASPWHVMQCGNDLMRHPKACIIFDNASETFGLEINIVRLRWKGWERDVATGSGREGRQKVSVRVWRLKRDCDGLGFAYTRIRVRSARGEVTAKLSTCPEVPNLDEGFSGYASPSSPAATVIAGECPEASEVITTGACAYPDGRVYLPPGSTRFMREHELGHVFDAQRLDAGERLKLKRLLGLPASAPWDAPGSYTGGSERFADAYAACRLRLDPERGWESSYDYYPSRRDLRRVCATIARAADWGPPKGAR